MQTDMSSLTNLDMHDQFAKPQSNGAALLKTNSSKEYSIHAYNTLKVYMTDFFICSVKSPQCTDNVLTCRVLMYQKHQISLPVGYKTARPKTGDWKRL